MTKKYARVNTIVNLLGCLYICSDQKIIQELTPLSTCVGVCTFRVTINYAQGNTIANLRGCMYISSDQKLCTR